MIANKFNSLKYNQQKEQPKMPYLSVIIPAYNEQKRLPETLYQITQFLITQDYSAEILVIDNASTDKTPLIAKEYSKKFNNIAVINEPKKGKGNAVKTGMLKAKGKYRFMCDADLSMPIDEIFRFLPPECNCEISIGSREEKGSIRYNEPISRHLYGRIFNLMVQAILLPGIKDTQCGFKCFKDYVAEDIINNLTLGGWSFDVEMLYIAKMRGYAISEIPISWYYSPESKVNPIQDSIKMFFDIIKIRRNAIHGQYKGM